MKREPRAAATPGSGTERAPARPQGALRPRPHCTVILSAAQRAGRTASRVPHRRVPRPAARLPPVLTHGTPDETAAPGGGRRGPAGEQEPGAAAAPEPSPPRRKWPPRLRGAAGRPGAGPASFPAAAGWGWHARHSALRARACAPPRGAPRAVRCREWPRRHSLCEVEEWAHLLPSRRAGNGCTCHEGSNP